jgi:iron complex transport system substrate-binding protein
LTRITQVAAAIVAGALLLGGCAATAPETEGLSGSGDFPVTLDHAFGETTVEAEPERVVTWGWGSSDAALALGVVPVAMAHQSYGGDEDGVHPWAAEQLEELGPKSNTNS